MSLNNENLHCVQVTKVYDWVMRPLEFQVMKRIKDRKKLVSDYVSGHINIRCGTPALLWRSPSNLAVSGSVTISHLTGCDEMEVLINGEKVFSVFHGQSRSITSLHLQSVEVRCKNGSDFCTGKYCLNLHYRLGQVFFFEEDCLLVSYLSDQDGNPIESIQCKNIQQNGNREKKELYQNNEKSSIRKVNILKKGFVTTKVICRGKIHCLCTVPFHFVETFFLCAPNGTSVECRVTNVSSEPQLSCERDTKEKDHKIMITMQFFLEIQVVGKVNLEVQAVSCLPRHDIQNKSCLLTQ